MIFLSIALLVSIALALIVSWDVGALIGLPEADTAQFVVMAVLLLVLTSSLFSRRMPFKRLAAGALAWIAIFAVVIGGYSYRDELSGFANRFVGELIPQEGIISADGQVVTFQRGIGRSFTLNAQVNGAKTKMIFDTGATAVVLTFADARRAGIDVDRLRFNVRVQTANGVGQAASIRLEALSVGGIARERIQAFVAEPDALETSLLGMSYLETLQSYTVSQNTLELRG